MPCCPRGCVFIRPHPMRAIRGPYMPCTGEYILKGSINPQARGGLRVVQWDRAPTAKNRATPGDTWGAPVGAPRGSSGLPTMPTPGGTQGGHTPGRFGGPGEPCSQAPPGAAIYMVAQGAHNRGHTWGHLQTVAQGACVKGLPLPWGCLYHTGHAMWNVNVDIIQNAS